MNIEKIAEERYPNTYYDGVVWRDDRLAPMKRQVFISGYQVATQRTEELERELEEFTEWLGTNYVKLHKVWVHRYASQTQPENFLTYAQLRETFKRHQKTMTDFLNSDR